MKGWQRRVTLFLALLLAWMPLGASRAQETPDSLNLCMAWKVEGEAFFTALDALDVDLDTDEQKALDAVIALLNAAEVRLQFGMDGEQIRASLMLSGTEILYLQEDVYRGNRYLTSNLFPGVALTVPQSEIWDIAQAVWRVDWASLGREMKADAEYWAVSLAQQYETGVFLGNVISKADARTSYVIEDQDLAALVDAWVETLQAREDAAALADALSGPGYWNAWLNMVEDFNRQVALENAYRYDVSVLWDASDEPVGAVVSGNLREASERPWQLALGWDDREVDMLATLPQGTEDVLLRLTLSGDAQTFSHRVHLLNGKAGEGYDAAAEHPEEELLLEGETRLFSEGMLQQAEYRGSASLHAAGMDLEFRQEGQSALDLADFSIRSSAQTYLSDDSLLYTQTLSGELAAAAAMPDFDQLTVLTPETLISMELYEALEQGINQLYVRVFKAIPSECIDLLIQMMLELP